MYQNKLIPSTDSLACGLTERQTGRILVLLGVPVVEGEGFCAASLEAVEKELIRILVTDIIMNVQRELSLGKIPLWWDNEAIP